MTGYHQVFVLGAPRSGTTFLSSLLEKSRFGAPFETHFIPKYYRKIEDYGDLAQKENFLRLASAILAERPVQQWKLQLDASDLYDLVKPDFSYSNLVNSLLAFKRGGCRDWGDKTPNYLENPEFLAQLFPDAKYIFIVRDGRDVALSLLQKPWGPNTMLACGEYWSRLNSNYLNFQHKLSPNNVLSIKYEELIQDTESHIRSVYRFLDEDIDENTVKKLASPVKGNNSEKWRTRLTPKQLRIFESQAKEQLEGFGYPVITKSPQTFWLERKQYALYEKYKRFMFLFKANVVDGIMIRFFGKEPFNE